MASKPLFALALSAAAAGAQTFQPFKFAGVNIPGFGMVCIAHDSGTI
jgi:hypothetical protein